MPSISSYSASPAAQSASKKPAASHSRKRLWMALALPKRSLGNAFHWQPVRSTYTMASNTWRAGFGGRPAPGLRRYFFSGEGARCGISGSTRCQNSSVTTQDSTRFAKISIQRRSTLRLGPVVYLFTDRFLGGGCAVEPVTCNGRTAAANATVRSVFVIGPGKGDETGSDLSDDCGSRASMRYCRQGQDVDHRQTPTRTWFPKAGRRGSPACGS